MFNWFAFFSYILVTAFTPGPNTISSMSSGSCSGFKKTLPYILGIWSGFTVVMLLCTLFCNILTGLIPKIKLPMLIIGAAYILFLAWKIFRNKPIVEAEGAQNGFLAGVALQFVNPKVYIYGIVALEGYILPYYQGQTLILIVFALLLSSVSFVSNLCWALFGSVFKLLFSRYSRITNTIMALLLVYCAVSLFF